MATLAELNGLQPPSTLIPAFRTCLPRPLTANLPPAHRRPFRRRNGAASPHLPAYATMPDLRHAPAPHTEQPENPNAFQHESYHEVRTAPLLALPRSPLPSTPEPVTHKTPAPHVYCKFH